VWTSEKAFTKPAKGAESLLRFVARQIRQIREGGLPVWRRKVTIFSMMPTAAVVLLLAFMARPLVLIRFGRLVSQRIGPFAARPDLYLCQRDADIPDRRTLDIFFCDGRACNAEDIAGLPWRKVALHPGRHFTGF